MSSWVISHLIDGARSVAFTLAVLCVADTAIAQRYSIDSVTPAYYLRNYGLWYEGRIGEKHVNIKIVPGKMAQLGGHYYSRDLKEHLIAGEISGPRDLHLVELDSTNAPVATLSLRFSDYDTLSTLRGHRLQGDVITGTYEVGDRTQPIRLLHSGFIFDEDDRKPWRDHERQAEQRIQRFVGALLVNDRQGVLANVKYPLRINGFHNGKRHPKRHTMIKTRQKLLRWYGAIFNNLFIEWIMTDIPKDLPRLSTDRSRDETGIMMAAGTAWFDLDGYLTDVNLPEGHPPSLF